MQPSSGSRRGRWSRPLEGFVRTGEGPIPRPRRSHGFGSVAGSAGVAGQRRARPRSPASRPARPLDLMSLPPDPGRRRITCWAASPRQTWIHLVPVHPDTGRDLVIVQTPRRPGCERADEGGLHLLAGRCLGAQRHSTRTSRPTTSRIWSPSRWPVCRASVPGARRSLSGPSRCRPGPPREPKPCGSEVQELFAIPA
jgi:hypothetical protein